MPKSTSKNKEEVQEAVPPPPWKGPSTGVHQQSVLDENNMLLKETHKMIKHIRVMQAIKLGITILFLVVPVIATLLVLPKFLSNASRALSSFTGDAPGEGGSIFEFFNGINEINEKTNPAEVNAELNALEEAGVDTVK